MRRPPLAAAALLAVLAAPLQAQSSTPREREAREEARCRPDEPGPAYRVAVDGLRDRRGRLWLDLYPGNDDDFLAPTRERRAARTPFRRVVVDVPAAGPVVLCIRAPGPGRWALAVQHDRDGDGGFGRLRDGLGFPGVAGDARPPAEAVALPVTRGVVDATVVMNYRRGLLGFGPIG